MEGDRLAHHRAGLDRGGRVGFPTELRTHASTLSSPCHRDRVALQGLVASSLPQLTARVRSIASPRSQAAAADARLRFLNRMTSVERFCILI
jgi:hypothetical protein